MLGLYSWGCFPTPLDDLPEFNDMARCLDGPDMADMADMAG